VTDAAARLAVVQELTLVEVSEEEMTLAQALLQRAGLPASAHEDALHIATSAVTGMDYLLTWNCKHIANGMIIPRLTRS